MYNFQQQQKNASLAGWGPLAAVIIVWFLAPVHCQVDDNALVDSATGSTETRSSCDCSCCAVEEALPAQAEYSGYDWQCSPRMAGAQPACADPCEVTSTLQFTTGLTGTSASVAQYCLYECMANRSVLSANLTTLRVTDDTEDLICNAIDSEFLEKMGKVNVNDEKLLKIVPLPKTPGDADRGAGTSATTQEDVSEQVIQGPEPLTQTERTKEIMNAAESAVFKTQQIIDAGALNAENLANEAEGGAIAARASLENFDPASAASKLEGAAAGPAAAAGLLQKYHPRPKFAHTLRLHSFLHAASLQG